jgi:dextranase
MTTLTKIDALSLQPHRAFTRPGEMARWVLKFQSAAAGPAHLQVVITHLEQVLWTEDRQLNLLPGVNELELHWQPPEVAPRGYGLEIRLLDGDRVLAELSTAFDVLEHWTQAPRYGFLTDFSPGRADASETMEVLLAYNAILINRLLVLWQQPVFCAMTFRYCTGYI